MCSLWRGLDALTPTACATVVLDRYGGPRASPDVERKEVGAGDCAAGAEFSAAPSCPVAAVDEFQPGTLVR